MKIKTCSLIIGGLMMAACQKNFLDPKLVNQVNTQQGTFADSARTIQFVNNIYNSLGNAYGPARFNGKGSFAGACDEGQNADLTISNQANLISQATLTPTNIGAGSSLNSSDDRGYWYVYWIPIRAANIALRDIPSSPLSTGMKNRLMGECRFLRAFYYSCLMKMYGGLPLLGDQVFDANDGPPNVPRSSFEATVNYIISECDAAKALLFDANDTSKPQLWDPVSPGNDNGRATKGACDALKARVLLYAASPLFNGGNISSSLGGAHPELTGYSSFDVNRWKLAADAADAVINSNQYALKLDNTTAPGYGFYLAMTARPIQPAPEYILANMRPANTDLETVYDPPTRGGGAALFPYQELIDAFPMRNGKAITDATSGYDPANPYNNRDPRLNYSIMHNESLRYLKSAGTDTKVFTYNNALNDGFNVSTKTGYYVMKGLDDKNGVTGAGGNQTLRCLPLIRYAEIILSDAEATNEFSGPTNKVYQLLGQIRNRAGILPGTDGLYGVPAGLSQADMRGFIQNERRLELAFEDQRIWDIHRWKIGPQTMNKQQHGVNITQVSSGVYTYNYVVSNTTYWKDGLYLMPISAYEIARNPAMIQNPGW